MRFHLAAAATALALQFSAANAQSIVALIGEDQLATFDAKAGKAGAATRIEGIGPVLGVDVRPADGQLYGVAADGTIVTIDPASGQATVKSKLDTPLPENVDISVDFNPVADRLRIIGTDGTNLRINVDDGKVTKDQPLKFADGDAANGQAPTVIAAGYTNAVKGAKETTLYDIDGGQGVLVRQAPPNDGVLNSIGRLGMEAPSIGFDIMTDASGANSAMLVANGSLHTLDLTSGKVSAGRKIAGLPADVRDIAVLPGSAPKRAAGLPETDAVDVKAGAGNTAGYLPGDLPGVPAAAPKPVTKKAAYTPKDDFAAKPVRKDVRSAGYSAPKQKRALCNGKATAQY